MKKNGFTLVEVLAMLVIISIIMVVAIPNISGMLKNQRLNVYKNDANSMVEAAKMKVSKEEMFVKPQAGQCIVFPLNYLDENDNIVKGPNGGEYNKFDSVVVYTRVDDVNTNTKKYKYYVRLVEEYDGKREGIHLIESIDIKNLKTRDINLIEDNIGLTKFDRTSEGIAKLSVFASIMAYCETINGYYSGGNYCIKVNNDYYDANGNIVEYQDYLASCSNS